MTAEEVSMTATDDLDRLVAAATAATPNDRIAFRDPIAAHGPAAVAAMRPLLASPTMRSFAIRVIEASAANGGRAEAITALSSMPKGTPPHIVADADAALGRLGARRVASGGGRSTPPEPVTVDDDLVAFLVDAARQGRTVSYTEAGAVIGLSMRNPNHRRVLGQHLGAISEQEALHGRPMLSAIVVHKGSKRLGSGFYQLGEELRLKSIGEDEDDFAERELRLVFEYWAGH
jgi:hypothetical protein